MRKLIPVLSVALAAGFAVGQEYQEEKGFEGATISGRVVWGGDKAPGPVMLSANKNPETCCGDGAVKECPKDSKRLVVNAENMGVKNCVVYLANYDLGTPGKPFPKAEKIDQTGCQYEPHVVLAKVGSQVTITNSDELLHNIHAWMGADTVFNRAQPNKGARDKEQLNQPGRINLTCDAGHTWMGAWIWVIEHPYHAITDENGNFELTNVPDGIYELVVWHEGWEILETRKNDQGDVSAYIFSDPIELGPYEVIVDGDTVEGVPETIKLGGE